ncbi:MAG: RNA polymerase factor sigma-54 [Pseudomonadota bacterium]
MALEIKQNLRLSQQLIMTPQLQQAIKLLQLSRLELAETINQEMETNPILEESVEEEFHEDGRLPEEYSEKIATSADSVDEPVPLPPEQPREDIDWQSLLGESDMGHRTGGEYEEREMPSFESTYSKRPSLDSHLMWQLRLSALNENERLVATLIIGNLNKDGYLAATITEIAAAADTAEPFVEAVLTKVQTFDPPGVAARDLKECLLIQTRLLRLTGTLVERIISGHLHNLEIRNYKAICRDCKASIEEVCAAVEVITSMEPKPGRLYSDEEPKYITPDIYVHKVGDDFIIVLNEDGLPKLRVNPFYRDALLRNKQMPDGAREYIQNKMRSAMWLIRSIHQRQRTIYRVTESIIKFQRDFFERGIAYLKPLVLRDVAEDVSMHESTISRVTTNKYIHTPQGVFELKFFFNSAINRVEGDSIASESVKEKIRQIIQREDGHRPYSDKKIAELLEKANISIARRTVAKYRELMGFLPSGKRKKLRLM